MLCKCDKYPLSILTVFNAQTLDYWVDNQAFVRFCTPSVFGIKKAASGGRSLFDNREKVISRKMAIIIV
jgi:hypothetical protein